MHEKFLSPYKPEETEDRIYAMWNEQKLFTPEESISRGLSTATSEVFSIVLPPPNVTGVLHMGHAAMLAIQDIVVRTARMQGKRTLWLPGTDHAAIATQSKVEKILEKEKISKRDLGRDEFLKRVNTFAQESHDTIVTQVKKMGSSVDWSREAFTLDEKRTLAVRTAFKRMYDDGLIYRGHRIVNWDPKGQTTISDEEMVYVEEKTKLYYFQYGPFVISTARPETKFADKYIVMHPDDTRYAEYKHGDQFTLEWINGPMTATVIKDEAIDMTFGTGVMTITPWHSTVDFEMAERHKLDKEQIIDEFGKLLPIAGEEFAKMKIAEARQKIVEKLREKGLLVKEEDYIHQIATAERTGATIEPQVKLQWFIDVNKPFTLPHSEITGIASGSKTTLKEIMRQAVIGGQITITPERFDKTYFQWVDNLRDWCISRQIWYGHQVPVWYKDKEIYCGIEGPEDTGWTQDSDTLDTWFSSGLWTFSTLGWPDIENADLKTYHPTTLLETGYDILFFWVARMVLMTGYHLGTIPFRTVYLHGLVRDAKGKKMSKSLGNIIDPLDMIAKYGADATRLSLIIGAGPGSDMNLAEDKIRGYKKYTNKIWNITRFILTYSNDIDISKEVALTDEDKKLIEDFAVMVKEVSEHIATYRLHLAGEVLYHYTWNTLADVIIEAKKDALNNGPELEKQSAQWTLRYILENLLKLQHPFLPFVTEEIWQSLPNRTQPLIVTHWPS